MDFQKYNIKEKKKKKRKKPQELLKTTTTDRLYMVFALKNRVFFFLKAIIGYRSKN